MSTLTVLQQMLIIIILIAVGFIIYKKGAVGDEGARTLSFLVLNITNPCFIISGSFSEEPVSITHLEILSALALTVALYLVMMGLGFLIPRILRARKADYVPYSMLTVYSNVGFVGIPVAIAVAGQDSLVFVTLFNVVYNLFFYSHGYMRMLKGSGSAGISWKSFINIGTVSSVIALLIFWFNIRLPIVAENAIQYTGRATTFLAMMVLGISFAKLPIKRLLANPRIYAMVAIRYLAFPIVCALLLMHFFGSGLMVSTMVLMLAMPAGNSPLMLAARYNLETGTLSSGILVSTLLSVITVTLTSLVI